MNEFFEELKDNWRSVLSVVFFLGCLYLHDLYIWSATPVDRTASLAFVVCALTVAVVISGWAERYRPKWMEALKMKDARYCAALVFWGTAVVGVMSATKDMPFWVYTAALFVCFLAALGILGFYETLYKLWFGRYK